MATATQTKFIRKNFSFHGGYLCYHENPYVASNGATINDMNSSRFVARFKYFRKGKARFLTFLIKNFTVEEYFDRLETKRETPVGILASKGYTSLITNAR